MTPLEYERMRFDSMTRRQLTTRLGRITKTEKLINYAKMAYEFKYFDLSRSALKKLGDRGVQLRADWAREVQGKEKDKFNVDTRQWYREGEKRADTRKKADKPQTKKKRRVKKEVVLDESDEIFGAYPIM